MFILLFCCVALSVVSCAKDELPPKEYAQFVESKESGLRVSEMVGRLKFELQYRPIDYVIVNEHRQTSISKEIYNEIKKEVDGMLYFNLKISLISGEGQRDLSTDPNLESFAQFALRNQIKLNVGDKSVSPSLYHYESGQGLKPYGTVVLGFESQQITESDLVIIIEQYLEQIPVNVTLTIKQEDLKNIPNLKLSGK